MSLESIYFDNNATTRVDENVLETMLPYFTEMYGNASSKIHAYGWQAEAAVENARNTMASILNCEPGEFIFTSGATESINLAIKGIFKAYRSKGNHIVTTATEHKAVSDVIEELKTEGAEVTYLSVNREGEIDLEELERAITDNTLLVAIMAANNETGVLHPTERIGAICDERKTIFFTDATQFVGKMRCDIAEMNIHCMAFSAHKFHGPKGIGALYVRRRTPRVSLKAMIHGGGHQNDLRSGTLNVPGIVGMAKALDVFSQNYWEINAHVSKLKNHFEHQLLDIEGLHINGTTRNRLYNTSNITFPVEFNIRSLFTNFAFSTGSACSSESNLPSHVLLNMGLSEDEIKRSFRFSFSKFNTLEEVDLLLKRIKS